MPEKKERYDAFAVPRNFGEDGISFNGLSRRNLAEGCILAVASGYPILFYLQADLSFRIILICFVSLPLFFIGLIGYGGESLSQFLATIIRFIFRRRQLRYYIDAGEPEPPKKKGWQRIKAFFQKKDENTIRYKRQQTAKNRSLSDLLDWLFLSRSGKKSKASKDEPPSKPKSRKIYNMAQEFFPVADIREGMVITKDGRYVKIVEIQPINFLLRSASEQRDIILSFAELLRVAPVKIQFKSNANRADISKFLAHTMEEMKQETNPACVEMDKDYIRHIQTIATNNAISRRFFAIFEYENPLPAYHPSEKEIKFALESTARTFRSYLSKCGNSTVEFSSEKEENEYLLQLFHTLLDHYNTEERSLQDKVDKAFKLRLQGNNLEEMCTADYACPDMIDFRHARYVVIDGVYHAYLHIPSTGYKTLVGAAWLSPLINAGEAIDVDLFLHKMPSDRMQVQVSRNLRLNKAKIQDVSSTSADYNRMGDIMESGYYLQRGLNDGQEFFYLNVLVTVKAFSKKDLENRVSEVIKMMTAKQITLKYCAYMQERAFLSTLPLAKLDRKLYELGKRNVLTNTAASTYMFTSFEICDESGVLLGTNEHNNSLVVLDLFDQKKYKNPHLTILGTTGSGKTHTLQCLATRMRRKHVATYVIAPLKGHEFVRAAKAMGGQFIRISTGSPHCINVMEIRPMDNSANELLDDAIEEQSYLSMKIDSLLIFFSIIMPEMTNIEEQLLDEALVKTYSDFGITNDNSTLWDPLRPGQFRSMPILGDLYENLKSNPKAERLAIVLSRFVHGSAKSFNHQTNVDLSNPYTVIDLSYLKKKLLSAGMFIATDLIWDLARQNRLKQKAIVIDEAWQLIGSNSSPQAAEFLVEMAKIGRAYNTAILFASQDINDFFSLEGGKYGKAILSNSKTKIILNLEPHEAETCGEVLNLTATELHKIKNFDRGHGLLSSSGNNIAVHFQASALENSLITTDPEELRRIADEKKKGESGYVKEAPEAE